MQDRSKTWSVWMIKLQRLKRSENQEMDLQEKREKEEEKVSSEREEMAIVKVQEILFENQESRFSVRKDSLREQNMKAKEQ